jgi:hypothetical protein
MLCWMWPGSECVILRIDFCSSKRHFVRHAIVRRSASVNDVRNLSCFWSLFSRSNARQVNESWGYLDFHPPVDHREFIPKDSRCLCSSLFQHAFFMQECRPIRTFQKFITISHEEPEPNDARSQGFKIPDDSFHLPPAISVLEIWLLQLGLHECVWFAMALLFFVWGVRLSFPYVFSLYILIYKLSLRCRDCAFFISISNSNQLVISESHVLGFLQYLRVSISNLWVSNLS